MGSEAQFLAVIAGAMVLMAVLQAGFLAYGIRLARRVERVVEAVEREIRPALGRVDAISADAARTSALVVAQVERVDKVVGRLAAGADEAMTAARDSVVEPVRRGGAFLAGLQAAVLAFRDAGRTEETFREPSERASDERAARAG